LARTFVCTFCKKNTIVYYADENVMVSVQADMNVNITQAVDAFYATSMQ